jgi:hypothetical protein
VTAAPGISGKEIGTLLHQQRIAAIQQAQAQ